MRALRRRVLETHRLLQHRRSFWTLCFVCIHPSICIHCHPFTRSTDREGVSPAVCYCSSSLGLTCAFTRHNRFTFINCCPPSSHINTHSLGLVPCRQALSDLKSSDKDFVSRIIRLVCRLHSELFCVISIINSPTCCQTN